MRELTQYCSMTKRNKGFLLKEQELCRECERTFGSWHVDYLAPKPEETSSGTSSRRKKIRRQLKKFKLVQTRHALSMLKSGASRKVLLVALDTMLEKYDCELKRKGLRQSDLRWQLREQNELNCKELQKRDKLRLLFYRRRIEASARQPSDSRSDSEAEDSEKEEVSDKDLMPPLDVSDRERQKLFVEMRQEFCDEEKVTGDMLEDKMLSC